MDSLHVPSLSNSEVLSALKQLKPKRTRGLDGIPGFIINDCACAIVTPLIIIFNLSLNTDVFPDRWKKTRISPVF